jgi:hypothetical protein
MMTFDGFAPKKNVRANQARQEWAVQQLKYAKKHLKLRSKCSLTAAPCFGNIFILVRDLLDY